VIPAKIERADKVWLLIHDKPHEDKASSYRDTIVKEFKKLSIKVGIAQADRGLVQDNKGCKRDCTARKEK
jgi:hypothetical protein